MTEYANSDVDHSNELQKVDLNDLQSKTADELHKVFENILPWVMEASDPLEVLRENTSREPQVIESFLNSLYLFRINEVSVARDETETDAANLLVKRYQSLMIAAYQANLTVTTLYIGDGGGNVDIFVGVAGEGQVKETFKNQIQGFFPGKGIDFEAQATDEEKVIRSLSQMNFGGVITGVPPLKLDDEKQFVDFSPVIRSMQGHPYVLMTVSRPVPKAEASGQVMELMKIKDTCHGMTKRISSIMTTDGNSGGGSTGEIVSNNKGGTTSGFGSLSGTAGINLSGSVSHMVGGGAGIFGAAWGMYAFTTTGTVGSTYSGTITAGGSKAKNWKGDKKSSVDVAQNRSTVHGWSKSIGKSLQLEEQNSLAMELEQISDKLVKRLRAGLNSGIWENFMTYATVDEISARILAGTICGELIKCDPESLPSRTFGAPLLLEAGEASQTKKLPIYYPTPSLKTHIIKGNPLVSYLSSDEAARLMAPPMISVPGFDIRVKPALSLTDASYSPVSRKIGAISEHGREIKGSAFGVSDEDLRKHVFVAGLTGSGKTTTVKELLNATSKPFLILESAKREYRRLYKCDKYHQNLRVYTVGDSTLSPFRHNPFFILPKVSALTHIDHLKSMFNASFALYGPMPYILEQCLHNIYKSKGWNLTTGEHHVVKIESLEQARKHLRLYPTIRDLIREVNRYVQEDLSYKGELQDNIRSAIVARLESLAVGAKGFIFNTSQVCDIQELLENRVVFELESLADDDDKAFFVALILSLVTQFRQAVANEGNLFASDELKHILVIEEAHRLLKNIPTERSSEMMGNPKGKAVEMFCNMIAEMRSLGQGVIVAEQIPTKIAPDVIKNTNTKIIHRLVSSDDQKAVSAGIGLPDRDAHYLNQLSRGYALAHKEGMSKPVEVFVHQTLVNEPVGNDYIQEKGRKLYGKSLQKDLQLHESGLMDHPRVSAIAAKLVHSVILSELPLFDGVESARKELKLEIKNRFLTDQVIDQVLRAWFTKLLLSESYDVGNGKEPSDKVLEAIDRVWDEPDQFDTKRLIYCLSEWRDGDCKSAVAEAVSMMVLSAYIPRRQETTLDNEIEKELLRLDPEAGRIIKTEIRKMGVL